MANFMRVDNPHNVQISRLPIHKALQFHESARVNICSDAKFAFYIRAKI